MAAVPEPAPEHPLRCTSSEVWALAQVEIPATLILWGLSSELTGSGNSNLFPLVLQGLEWGCFMQLIILIISDFSVPSTPVHPIPYIKFSMSKHLVLFQFICKSLTDTYGQSLRSFLDYENKGHILGMAE